MTREANRNFGGDARLIYPSDYICAADLRDTAHRLKIKSFSIDPIMTESRPIPKPVIGFANAQKRFIVCKTNVLRIISVHGPKVEDWIGREIELYPTACASFGRIVECIRVRPAPGYAYPTYDAEYAMSDVGQLSAKAKAVRRG